MLLRLPSVKLVALFTFWSKNIPLPLLHGIGFIYCEMSKCSSSKFFAQFGNTPVGTASSLFHLDNEKPFNYTQIKPIISLSKQITIYTIFHFQTTKSVTTLSLRHEIYTLEMSSNNLLTHIFGTQDEITHHY